jgi:hypothetical protein
MSVPPKAILWIALAALLATASNLRQIGGHDKPWSAIPQD